MTIDIQFTPSPLDNPDVWDFVWIEDVKLPCLKKIPEISVGRKVDVKAKAGSDNVTITDKGQDVNKVKITLTFWLSEHFETWDEIKDLVSARKRARDRRPLAVYHPALAQLGVNVIYTERVHGMKHVEHGMYEVTIDAYEYRDPPPRNRNATVRAQRTVDIVRPTAFTSLIQTAIAQSMANFQSARPSQNGAANP